MTTKLCTRAGVVAILAIVAIHANTLLAGADVTITEIKPALPAIPDKTFTLTDFGAVGDGKTLNTDAFKKAIAAVEAAGGGKLVVPRGVFRTLGFTLCSNLDLHLDEGAMIQAPDSFKDYGIPEPSTFKTQAEVNAAVRAPGPLISGRNVHDVAITGAGTIDGSGAIFWAWSQRAGRQAHDPNRIYYPRSSMIVISGCQRLRVADVTMSNSMQTHFAPQNVTDLLVEKVKVRTPWQAPNTDAIDPNSCTNVLIRDCDIDTGDDDICIKTGGNNILIENCIIKHGHGISIGSGTTGGIHNMLVRNCTMEDTLYGIRLKSMRGAGGPVENIRYTNIKMRNVDNAILMYLDYVDNNRPDFKGPANLIPSIKHIEIDNVTAEGSKNAGRIAGLDDSLITDITLKNVSITAESDLTIEKADKPVLENVKINVKPGVAPVREPFIE